MRNKRTKVGVGLDQPAKNNRGITLIALIITIIVMLILVSVAVRSAINSGLFGHAKDAVGKWADEQKKEEEIDINELINKYVDDDDVIEPDDINEWRWRVETAETALKPEYVGTITLLEYLGTKTEIIVPNSIGGVPVKVLGNGYPHWYLPGAEYVWCYASSLWTLDEEEHPGTFEGYCANSTITQVSVSAGVESISPYAFTNCLVLSSVKLPSTIRSVGGLAFHGCDSLKSIFLPASIDHIDGHAFRNCGLEDIYCEVSEKPEGWDDQWDVTVKDKIHWGTKMPD